MRTSVIFPAAHQVRSARPAFLPFLRRSSPPRPRGTRAFSLVELALAVGITSFCILTLIALLPSGLRSADTASRQSNAVNLGTGVLADLKSTASFAADNSISPPPATTRYGLTIPTTANTATQYALYLDTNGNSQPVAQAQFLAILTLICPNYAGNPGGLPKPAVIAQLLITWPAAANPSLPTSAQTYTPGSSTDLRAQVKNFNSSVEMAGTVNLDQ